MNDKIKNIISLCLCAALIFGLFTWQLVSPSKDFSESERRQLTAFPQINMKSVTSGRFMEKFEDYSMDQFPMRDTFRSIKAYASAYALRQSDKGGIYIKYGYISKLEYPMSESSIDNAAAKLTSVYNKYLKDNNTKVYLSIVPDKNKLLGDKYGYPAIDYDEFSKELTDKLDFAEYIDIYDYLDLSDYYKTDTHWRQEKIVDVAQEIGSSMGAQIDTQYDVMTLDKDFYGVYYGQAALPIDAEKLNYLENDTLRSCTVYDHEDNKERGIYDMELAHGKDPYEMFLSGSKALLTIKNPMADNDKHLIVFRDSFGSSITPLLATGYSETTVIDIRYISSEIIGTMVDFENSDVLFIYSTLVLNNSVTFK